ncbi:MAG: hypothetical protein PHP57_06390 [Sideroxydans sp.]|nr:hypothetical protein [Sideroxydans sp.]
MKNLVLLAVLATLATSAQAEVYGGMAIGSNGHGTGEVNVGFSIIEEDTHSLNFEVTGSKVVLKATQNLFGGTVQPAQAGTPATVTGPGTPATPAQLVPFATSTATGAVTGTGNAVALGSRFGGALVFKGQVTESVLIVLKGGVQSFKTSSSAGTAGGFLTGTSGITGGLLGKALGENDIEPTVSVGMDYRIPGMKGTAVTTRVSFAPSQQESLNIGLQYSFK